MTRLFHCRGDHTLMTRACAGLAARANAPIIADVGFGILLVASSRVRVQGNRLTNTAWPIATSGGTANVLADNSLVRGGGGITAVFHASLTCSQNRVEDMPHWGILSLVGFAKCALTENRILNCGYQQAPSIGIGASVQLGELCVESCEVMNTGVSPDNATISALSWGIIADLILEARVQSNLITYANAALLDANQEHRALCIRGLVAGAPVRRWADGFHWKMSTMRPSPVPPQVSAQVASSSR